MLQAPTALFSPISKEFISPSDGGSALGDGCGGAALGSTGGDSAKLSVATEF